VFDVFLDYLKKILKSRLFPIAVIYLALFAVVINRLFVLQIVRGQEIVEKHEAKYIKTREIKSTRGNIYDRKGKLLASNVLSYSVVMEDSTRIESNDQRNEVINKLIKIIENNGDTLDTDFYIKQNAKGEFEFTVQGSALTRFLKNAYAYILDDKEKLSQEQQKNYLKSAYDYLINGETAPDEEQKKIIAKDTYEFLRDGTGNDYTDMFGISDRYSVDEILKIMSVRYALFCNYPKYLQITVASDVSDLTFAAVKEDGAELPGVEVQQQTRRVCEDALYFAHIIGYTGLIGQEELEAAEEAGLDYNSTDYIGKYGLEKEYEKELSGTKGEETVSVNAGGKVIDIIERKEPVAGDDIYLTIDSDLQRNAYHILEKEIAKILLENIVPNLDYGSKGESADSIKIPVYEVYYALIDNNVLDITAFNAPGATELEKETYQKYLDARDEVMSQLDELLAMDSTTLNSKAGDMEEFLNYFYSVLTSQNILLTADIPEDDATYKAYQSGSISLSNFIKYALVNNWVDLAKLGIGSEYQTTQESYRKLIAFTENILKSDDKFNKKIYRKLVFSYKLSGTEICLLLFDQGVLEYKEQDVNALKDSNSSQFAYQFIRDKIINLEITPGMLALEPCSGSLVVTAVNGDVLALVSYPSYDNNKFVNKIDYEYFTKLNNDKSYPLRNKPVMQRTAPGSTFKIVTSFAALEEGVTNPGERIFDAGIFDKIFPPARCHIYPGSHGAVNIVDALKVSCNYFFYEMGWRLSINSQGLYDEKLGLSKLEKYATLFGLNEPSGIELSELSPVISEKDAVRSAIGQGSNEYTPVQMARYITTLANRGTCYNLTLLDKVVNKDGGIVMDNSATVNHMLTDIKASTWDSVFEGLYSVVNDPNGGSVYSTFKDLGVTVAGKTGTSQRSKVEPNNALFISFAPYEKPEIAVTAVIPFGYTSHNTAELARDIYKLYYGLEDAESLAGGSVSLDNTNTGGALE
jgi:penicillin-binding protein 2